MAGVTTNVWATFSTLWAGIATGRLITNNADPIMVMASDTGRATTTSTATDVAAVSPAAEAGVIVLSKSANTQRKVVNNLVFI